MSRRRNQQNLDAHKTTRKSKANTELVAQLQEYAAAVKAARAAKVEAPFIWQFIPSMKPVAVVK